MSPITSFKQNSVIFVNVIFFTDIHSIPIGILEVQQENILLQCLSATIFRDDRLGAFEINSGVALE